MSSWPMDLGASPPRPKAASPEPPARVLLAAAAAAAKASKAKALAAASASASNSRAVTLHGRSGSTSATQGQTNGRVSSASAAAAAAAAAAATASRLTEMEKKNNHIASEQKRRQAIRDAFDRLTEIVPGLEGQGRSESIVLKKTVEYIQQTLEEREQLQEAIRARGGTV